jgi:hypothetical protein
VLILGIVLYCIVLYCIVLYCIVLYFQVEEILRNKIKDNWKSVSNAFIDVDMNRDGHLSRDELRKLLERYCLPLTDEHFEM